MAAVTALAVVMVMGLTLLVLACTGNSNRVNRFDHSCLLNGRGDLRCRFFSVATGFGSNRYNNVHGALSKGIMDVEDGKPCQRRYSSHNVYRNRHTNCTL